MRTVFFAYFHSVWLNLWVWNLQIWNADYMHFIVLTVSFFTITADSFFISVFLQAQPLDPVLVSTKPVCTVPLPGFSSQCESMHLPAQPACLQEVPFSIALMPPASQQPPETPNPCKERLLAVFPASPWSWMCGFLLLPSCAPFTGVLPIWSAFGQLSGFLVKLNEKQ